MRKTKDMKQVYLDITNSYYPHGKAPIDFYLAKAVLLFNHKGYETGFCCSGHTDEKPGKIWLDDGTFLTFKPNAYISFKGKYDNLPGQENMRGNSVLRFHHCGTLMGIKKACRKLYRIAREIEPIKKEEK